VKRLHRLCTISGNFSTVTLWRAVKRHHFWYCFYGGATGQATTFNTLLFLFATLNDAVWLKHRLGILSSGGFYCDGEMPIYGNGTWLCAVQNCSKRKQKVTILHCNATSVCTCAKALNQKEAQKQLDLFTVNVKLDSMVENVASQTYCFYSGATGRAATFNTLPFCLQC
jgi:hypothetical protein